MIKLRRLIWYLASRLFVMVLVLGLCIVTFYYAMNATNIYIVLKDGMAKRAQIIMMNDTDTDLQSYFLASYMQRDENLQNALAGKSPYQYYTIRGIDHRLSMEWMWAWPWGKTARVEFSESIPRIDGRLNGNYTQMAQNLYGEGYENPPAWPAMEYIATMVKKDNRWYVQSVTHQKSRK